MNGVTVERADVVVAGAGPAGAAAALALARAGVDVLLVDRARFPRDKTCGDALIPDALRALDRLGVLGAVRREGRTLAGARIVAPGGNRLDLDVPVVTLPRRRLDHLLVEAAREAGARLLEGVAVEGPLEEGGRVTGVVGHRAGGGPRVRVEAPVTVLATGAAARVLRAFGVLRRRRPDALALRGYFEVGELPDRIVISYEEELIPGYAWIFPVGDGVCNVGLARFAPARGELRANLRRDLDRFVHDSAPGRRYLTGARLREPVRGAPIRTGLQGSRWWRPGLLVAGEAIGTTYATSGEGIGKALETGGLAAEAALHALSAPTRGEADRRLAAYPRRIREVCGPMHRAYATAQRWIRFPGVVKLVIRRANQDPAVTRVLERILREEDRVSRVVSFRGLVRLALLRPRVRG